MTNPLLDKTKAAILAKVDPRLRIVVQKIVNAGQKVMFSPQSRHLMQQQLQAGADNPEVIGSGIAKLVAVLFSQSKKTAPINALIPAGMILLCDGLQFIEDAGVVKVDAPFLAKCTQATASAVLQVLGIKPEQVQAAIDQARTKMPGAPPPAGAVPAAPGPTPPAQGIVGAAMGAS